jgi:hypothetical protein
VIVLGFIAAGLAANAAVVGTCKMLKLNRGAGYIGPWRADIDGSGCISWDKDATELDDWIINMARACSLMALCFGSVLALFAFFNQCLCPLPCTQPILDFSGVALQISLALTWPMVRTSACDEFGGCTWDDGATSLLLSQVFYFCASIFTRCMREPRWKRRQNEPREPRSVKNDAEKTKAAAEGGKIAKEGEETEMDAHLDGNKLDPSDEDEDAKKQVSA